jgi:hypothetical protein
MVPIHIERPNLSGCEFGDRLDFPAEAAPSSRIRLPHDFVGLAGTCPYRVPDKKIVEDMNA